MKPNILRFWFWRARLLIAGLHDNKEKIAKIQLNDELFIELHPATTDAEGRPFLKLSRMTQTEHQSLVIYLKEIPILIDLLPKAVAQLMAFGAEQRNLRNKIRQQMDLVRSRAELVE
jgi:hypothetical protein